MDLNIQGLITHRKKTAITGGGRMAKVRGVEQDKKENLQNETQHTTDTGHAAPCQRDCSQTLVQIWSEAVELCKLSPCVQLRET